MLNASSLSILHNTPRKLWFVCRHNFLPVFAINRRRLP